MCGSLPEILFNFTLWGITRQNWCGCTFQMPLCSDAQRGPETTVWEWEVHQKPRPASVSRSRICVAPTPSAPRKDGGNVTAGANWGYWRASVPPVFCWFFPKIPELQTVGVSRIKDSVLMIGAPRNPPWQLSLGKIPSSRTIQAISFLPAHLAFSLPAIVLCNLPSSAWFGSGQTSSELVALNKNR